MRRIFFAIPVGGACVQQLLQYNQQLETQFPGKMTWIRPELWHITIHFFAEISAKVLTTIIADVASTLAQEKPFDLRLKKIACFPTPRSRVVAAHVKPKGHLKRLFVILNKAAEQAGLPVEARIFRPHISLGKFNQQPQPITPIWLDDLTVHVDQLVIYESKNTNEGKHYEALQQFAFLAK